MRYVSKIIEGSKILTVFDTVEKRELLRDTGSRYIFASQASADKVLKQLNDADTNSGKSSASEAPKTDSKTKGREKFTGTDDKPAMKVSPPKAATHVKGARIPKFAAGDRVSHKKDGLGTVTGNNGIKVAVTFDSGSKADVLVRMLNKAPDDAPQAPSTTKKARSPRKKGEAVQAAA